MSSPESALLPRDTDFGYEVIDKADEVKEGGDDEDTSSVSVADHYRGTPPLKGKKKKHHSHIVKSGKDSDSANETPPPLPPKKRDSQREREASVESTTSSIQSRPLPTPPTPRVQRIPPLPVEADEDNDEFHSLLSAAPSLPVEANEDNDEFHSLRSAAQTCIQTEILALFAMFTYLRTFLKKPKL